MVVHTETAELTGRSIMASEEWLVTPNSINIIDTIWLHRYIPDDRRLRPRPHQQQCRCNRQHCRNTFDFVEATFDTVERIVQLVAFDNVASTLLLVWTGLNIALLSVYCSE